MTIVPKIRIVDPRDGPKPTPPPCYTCRGKGYLYTGYSSGIIRCPHCNSWKSKPPNKKPATGNEKKIPCPKYRGKGYISLMQLGKILCPKC